MLFHDDNNTFYSVDSLRSYAAKVVRTSPFIRKAYNGDLKAAVDLHVGFWPFVKEFEIAIDSQSLPRQVLMSKFGGKKVRENFLFLAKSVREMKVEEGTHAAHWLKDSQELGLNNIATENVFPSVQKLIDNSYTKYLPDFFAVLAGTEFIAEELSRYLTESQDFKNLFTRRRWMWGEVHLASHEGPSHLDIDLDLARAYNTNDGNLYLIESKIINTIWLFSKAASEIDVIESVEIR